ncbi:MAG: hypothetical protein GY797_35035 [Deltaproteobacteria bacterium]|nr:hypothetical protein [Deltaproteobacteria bacterium]
MRINKITIESTLKQVENQLKDNKELPSNVKSLFKMLVLIIQVLVKRAPKKKTPKDKAKPKEKEIPIKELLGATQERTKLEELEEENERLKEELEDKGCKQGIEQTVIKAARMGGQRSRQ